MLKNSDFLSDEAVSELEQLLIICKSANVAVNSEKPVIPCLELVIDLSLWLSTMLDRDIVNLSERPNLEPRFLDLEKQDELGNSKSLYINVQDPATLKKVGRLEGLSSFFGDLAEFLVRVKNFGHLNSSFLSRLEEALRDVRYSIPILPSKERQSLVYVRGELVPFNWGEIRPEYIPSDQDVDMCTLRTARLSRTDAISRQLESMKSKFSSLACKSKTHNLHTSERHRSD